MIIAIIIVPIVILILIYIYLEKQELKQQNNNPSPILQAQKLEALRKEREEIEKRNSVRGTILQSGSKKDCTNNIIKTEGFYVTKTENPDGYMFLYFRKDGYVLKEFKKELLNTEAVDDTKNYMKKIHGVLHELNDSDLSFDFGKYNMDGNKINIEFLFNNDTHNPNGNIQQKSSITITGKIFYKNIEAKAISKEYKSALRIFEERSIFESESFSYKE